MSRQPGGGRRRVAFRSLPSHAAKPGTSCTPPARWSWRSRSRRPSAAATAGARHDRPARRRLPGRRGGRRRHAAARRPGVADPAHCAAPADYTGHHLLTLEEPYQDTNGNGRHDDGEPFQDCPVRRVDGTTAPPDGRWDGIYLGGGDCCDRQPTAVLDPIWARTIVVDNGDRRVSITSVDNEGVFKEYWDRVRAKVRADGTRLDEMFF